MEQNLGRKEDGWYAATGPRNSTSKKLLKQKETIEWKNAYIN